MRFAINFAAELSAFVKEHDLPLGLSKINSVSTLYTALLVCVTQLLSFNPPESMFLSSLICQLHQLSVWQNVLTPRNSSNVKAVYSRFFGYPRSRLCNDVKHGVALLQGSGDNEASLSSAIHTFTYENS